MQEGRAGKVPEISAADKSGRFERPSTLVPKLRLGTCPAKLCFACPNTAARRSAFGKIRFPPGRSQTEFGNEGKIHKLRAWERGEVSCRLHPAGRVKCRGNQKSVFAFLARTPMADYICVATWPFGQTAVKVAAEWLRQGRPALDAAIAGAQAVEDDPKVNSVGYGGIANAAGT